LPNAVGPLPGRLATGTILSTLFGGGLMDKTDGTYETPKVVASLDALGMITDADGMAVGVFCGSRCDTKRH
jgi:hypothetical protein